MRMMILLFFVAFGIVGFAALSSGQKKLQVDTVKTAGGNLAITFIGHGSLMFAWGGRIVHVDPYAAMTDYSKLPAADLILITHDHGDHRGVPELCIHNSGCLSIRKRSNTSAPPKPGSSSPRPRRESLKAASR